MSVLASISFGVTKDCSKLLSRDKTSDLKNYMSEWIERQVIGEEELQRWIEGLERGKILNPISGDRALVSIEAYTARIGIQEYLESSSINAKELLDWSRAVLKEKGRTRVSRKEAQEETQDVYRKIIFHPVKGGTFQMGEKGKKVEVELTQDIEVMSSPMTQKQYADLMGKNPSHFTEGPDSIVININGQAIKMRPGNPVEKVSWWDSLEGCQ